VYNPHSDSSYYVPTVEAQSLTKSKQAHWQGNKRIVLGTDMRQKVTWAIKQSGYAGPFVMQVVA